MPKNQTGNRKATRKTPKASGKTSKNTETGASQTAAFPIVGLGASAGGLDALKAFFAEVPENSGMAYVVVVHMTPKQPSMMPDLLQKVARIPVSTVEDGQGIEPDHVYIIPSNKDLMVFQGRMQLLELKSSKVAHPIDTFLSSLAQDREDRVAAVILSGTGTDGALGIKDVKIRNGLILVQSEETAGYDGMPKSAIQTGLVDMVLPPERMPSTLIQYFAHPRTTLPDKPLGAPPEQQAPLNKIFALLRTKTGHDFSAFKTNTILRRIGRRMGLHQIDDHETYVRFLRENPGEADVLFRELLIGVTKFFRDMESFDVLEKSVLPGLLERLEQGATFRAWVPGCSTGEEVYSLAMVLRECLEKTPQQTHLQLFGTDIDSFAIDKAREGLFPAGIAADVGEERLKRFFTPEGDLFRIRKEIRDCAVFSVQDVLRDPPFSRLDLLCCRNLLIYLNTEAQKKLLPLFHYTLKRDGILVLGSSETIGGFGNLFEMVDKKWKIFRRQEVPQALRQVVNFPSGGSPPEPAQEALPAGAPEKPADIGRLTQQVILDAFSPTAILIDAQGDMLHVQGRTGKYLEKTSGPPTNNILDLAREGLRIELSAALRAAKSSGDRVTRHRVSVKTNGDVQVIDLHVCPLQTPKELAGRFLVGFVDVESPSAEAGDRERGSDGAVDESSRITELEHELQITRESHQTTIEELECSNEELKSTNEEIQSSNEELESSKEELQTLNEELQTVNAELQSKVEELSAVHDDMNNLLSSTEMATIFVDNEMRVRRFTPNASRIVNLIPVDIHRPLRHVVSNLTYDGMIGDIQAVLEGLAPKEIEVQAAEGGWYNMRILPYRTMDNRIDGAVLTFSSIDEQKKAQEVLQSSMEEKESARELVRAIFDRNPEPMAVMDRAYKVVIANTGFSERFQVEQDDLFEKAFEELQKRLPPKTNLKSHLKAALKNGKGFETEPFEMATAEGKTRFVLYGEVIRTGPQKAHRILLIFRKAS